MEFKSDQARDASIIFKVVEKKSPWPVQGPSLGDDRKKVLEQNDSFHVGPIHYYFQIISAKIFGDYPDKLAYPDLFFSILTIPLFYFFLKRYFNKNLSLGLAGLYSISFFAVNYSRFAWNPNSIPFFVLLLILALYEFLKNKEQVGWKWVIILGLALGIGSQLHIISLMLFSVTTFFVFIFTIRKNLIIWSKWIIVFLIFIMLNLIQLNNELKTNFSNSNIFLNQISIHTADNNIMAKIENNADCHLEANFYMLFSLGGNNCSLNFVKFFIGNIPKTIDTLALKFILLGSFIFSFLGYFLFFRRFWKEKNLDKKYFLSLIAMYSGVVFLIMFFVVDDNIENRYFNCVFFMPFIFLGLFSNYLNKARFKLKVGNILILLLFFSIIVFNGFSIASAAKELLEKGKTGFHSDFLGVIDPVSKYLLENSNGNKNIYLAGNENIMHIYKPLKYFMEREDMNLIRIYRDNQIPFESFPVFYVTDKKPENPGYEKFGSIYIYKLSQ